jgi:outer membrane protein assembly factor BamA
MRLAVRLAALAIVVAAPLGAQDTASKGDWEWFALPALNFNSDEGFGYGALLDLYNYRGGRKPYRLMIRPLLAFSTKGKRDFTVVIDAPGVLPDGWRFDVFLGREQHLATPYYGIGNNTTKVETLTDPPDDYYYRYGRTQLRAAVNVQRRMSGPARFLVGAGFADVETDATPFDSGTTLLQQERIAQQGVANPTDRTGRIAMLRGGIVLDTRDREVGPTKGSWVDLLVQRAQHSGNSQDGAYTRGTISARNYTSLTSRIVFAQRVVVQHTDGDIPFFDLATIQNSSPTVQMEGLGGSSSMRGVEKNRYTARGIAFANLELRYRFKELRLLGKPAYLVGSAFADAGRVWRGDLFQGDPGTTHLSGGGGLRLGLGPSFLVAFDVAKSSESTQIYIGLGYPF